MRKKNNTHLPREQPHASHEKTLWRPAPQSLCTQDGLDRKPQWDLSAATKEPITHRVGSCHIIPARIGSQKSCGKTSILSAKRQRTATKYTNFTRYLQAPPSVTDPHAQKRPPQYPYTKTRFSRPY